MDFLANENFPHQTFPPAGVVYFRFALATPAEPSQILINLMNEVHLALNDKFTIIERGRVR